MRIALALAALLCVSRAHTADAPKLGDPVGKLKFTDTRSLPRTLDDFGKPKAVVLAFVNTTCPLAQRYVPTLNALEKDYRAKGVQFVAVNADDSDTLIVAASHAVKYDLAFPVVKDFGGACAKALGATRTPEVVVLDAERRVRYRGRIDDQFRLGGNRKEPTTHELRDALDAIINGKEIAVKESEVDGCAITFTKAREPRAVNFAEHVTPILYKHCGECHKTGGGAPFALVTHKQAAARADAIAEVVTDQRMPPWFAAHEFGPFVNRRALSDDEKTILRDWAKLGAPAGDLTKAPAPPAEQKAKWLIGEPDLVLDSQVFELPATGDIPYKYTILPHRFAEDTWVQGVQITTDNPKSLHHCNLAHAGIASGFGAENFVTGYVPGGEPTNLDNGIGFMMPKGSVLALQLHFVPTGKAETCKVSVGLRFPREEVRTRLRCMQLFDTKFAIPPHAPAHKVSAVRTLEADSVGVGVFAHMHLRGKDMSFTATAPDGTRDPFLVIANYNFEWQIPYRWESGKKTFAKGTKLECVARFDNSAFNPYNPDPKATVKNGPQTHNEMMYGFFFYTHANENLSLKIDPKTGAVRKP